MRLIAFALACGLAATTARAETPLERGRMLVEGVVACGNCHTPLDAQGQPVAGRALAGRLVEDNPAFRAVAPNITPDPETGIGRWTDAQLAKAIREGIRPDGSLIGPPMPFAFYRGLSDTDLAAIIAYLRSVPAVTQTNEKSAYRIPLPPAYGPPVTSVTAPPESDARAYGGYLAGPLGHCLDCQTPMLENGQRDMTRPGAGGFVL
jgi:mono/diheme cytochrome c family protein